MSLLDSDSKVIEKIEEKKKSKSSVGSSKRFKSLNRYAKYTESSAKEPKNVSPTKPVDKPVTSKQKNTATVIPEAVTDHIEILPPEPDKHKPEKKALQNALVKKVQKKKPVNVEKAIEPTVTSEPDTEYKTTDLKSTKRVQKEYYLEYKESTPRVQQEYELDNKESTNRVQIGVPNRAHISDDTPEVRLLSGQNKKLLDIFFEDCKSQGSLTTGKFVNEHLCKLLNVKPSTLKTLVYRLVKANYINRVPGRRGRGGWIQLVMPKAIYDQLLHLESNSSANIMNHVLENKWSTDRATHRSTNVPSSSSNFNFNNKSTSTSPLPEAWNIIQIPVNLKEVGFTMAHIRQLAEDNFFEPEEIQSSLESFSYDLEKGAIQARTGEINYFMGIVRKKHVPYVSSELMRKQKEDLDNYLKIRKEHDELVKLREEAGLVEKFEQWWPTLSKEEKNSFSKPSSFAPEGSEMQTKVARGTFIENRGVVGD